MALIQAIAHNSPMNMNTEKTIHTKRLTVDAQLLDEAALAEAAAIIQRGGLVAFPTETVYGLGANALDSTAVAKIFAAKERPSYDPLIVHVASADQLPQLTTHVPPIAQTLAAMFWPGALTLVLPKSAIVPDIVTAGGPTVAVRCPSHPLALALIRQAGTPIAAPSANRFSHTSPTTAQHVWDDLAGRIDLILDGGSTPIGVESTVLDVTGDVPVVLRPGGVAVEALRAVVDVVVPQKQMKKGTDMLASPGMLDKHYAPKAALWLFTGENWLARMQSELAAELANGRLPALLLAEEDLGAFMQFDVPKFVMPSAADLTAVARSLYASLRAADQPGTQLIFARDFPPEGLGLAIRDRLRRAAVRTIGD